MSKITIYDVAGAAKVSLATVSRVLNNPEKVKPDTRKRVLKVIQDMGYRPNAIARGLASRKSTTVGLIVPNVSRASVAEMINGVSDIAREYKYQIRLFVNSNLEYEEEMWKDVVASQVDGILYMNDEISSDDIQSVQKVDIPVVLVNTVCEDDSIAQVAIDYQKASYQVAKNLISKGLKDIYLVSTQRKYSVNDLKEKGFVKAMNEAGLEPKILRSSGKIDINEPQFNEFLDNNPVEAIIAVRDSIAVSFMNIAISKGMRVPEDIEVIGFQNTKYAQLARPKLSCVETPIYELGAASMKLLTKLMQEEDTGEFVEEINFILPHKIIYRDSTK